MYYTIYGLFFNDPLTPFMFGTLSIFGLFSQYLLFVQVFVTFYLLFVLFYCTLNYKKPETTMNFFHYTLLDMIVEFMCIKPKDFTTWLTLKNTKEAHYQHTYYDPSYRVYENVIPFLYVERAVFINAVTMLFVYRFKDLIYSKLFLKNITHNEIVESLWTFIPALILLVLAIPTFTLLYASDEIISNPTMVVKVLGNQWYWNYDVTFLSFLLGKIFTYNFDSYIASDFVYKRLLETSEPLYIAFDSKNLFLISSTDVIHSWTVPALGFKVDAIPGRLNAATIFVQALGTFNGQCSEICGAQHGFMPIELKIVPKFLTRILYDLKSFSSNDICYSKNSLDFNSIKVKYKIKENLISYKIEILK